MKMKIFLKVLIGKLLIRGNVSTGYVMSDFQFGKIERLSGEISLSEWSKIIKSDPTLEQMKDRKGVNPFTNEEVVFPGAGKAYYVESGERIGNISLENGVLLTTSVPENKCKQIGGLLGALVSKDDR